MRVDLVLNYLRMDVGALKWKYKWMDGWMNE